MNTRKQLVLVWKKEMREAWSNRKWVWLPLVFVLFGMMQPISAHFMPQILKLSGGLPPGTIIHIPTPSAASVLVKAQSQYGTLGLLILVLSFMSGVSGERQKGVLELVLVKPVSHAAYFLGKWLAAATLTLTALFVGELATWYYTVQLIGSLAAWRVILSTLVYALWLLLLITLTLVLSVMLRSSGANAFISLGAAVLLSVLAGILKWRWSPGSIPSHAADMLMQPNPLASAGTTHSWVGLDSLTWSLIVTALVMVSLVFAGIGWFRRHTFD